MGATDLYSTIHTENTFQTYHIHAHSDLMLLIINVPILEIRNWGCQWLIYNHWVISRLSWNLFSHDISDAYHVQVQQFINDQNGLRLLNLTAIQPALCYMEGPEHFLKLQKALCWRISSKWMQCLFYPISHATNQVLNNAERDMLVYLEQYKMGR